MGDPLGSPRVATPFLFFRIVFQPRVAILVYFIFLMDILFILMDFIITIGITHIMFDGEKNVIFFLIKPRSANRTRTGGGCAREKYGKREKQKTDGRG